MLLLVVSLGHFQSEIITRLTSFQKCLALSVIHGLFFFVVDENKEKVNDQAKLIVGIVVGLLLAALVAGVVYWLYMKKSK